MTLVPESKPEEPSSCTEINAVVPSEAEFSTSTAKSSAKMRASSPAAVARFSRRRNSTGKRKKEAAKSSTQKPQTSVRERRKSNEGKNSQAKGRRRRSSEVNNKVQHDEKDDSESESDESWDSEDDPDRLWCICKKPHNNCFMICCDSCEDWFHGKCVGVTKSMGKQMELNGVEWVCPNCIKKKEIEEKEREKQKDKEREKQKEKEREKQKEKEREMEKEREKEKEKEREMKKLAKPSKEKEDTKSTVKKLPQKENVKDSKECSNNDESMTCAPVKKLLPKSANDGKSNCLICKNEAQPDSMYCSDACILKHTQEPVYGYIAKPSSEGQTSHDNESTASVQTQMLVKPASTTTELLRPSTDDRIMMKMQCLMAELDDPTVGSVKTLLSDNPASFRMRPDIAPTLFHMHQNELQHKHTHLENLVSFQSRSLERPVEAVPMQTIPIPSPIIANNAHSVQLADPAAVPMVSTVIVPRDDAAAEEAFNVGHGVQYPPAANMQILRDDLMKNGRITADVKKIKTSDVKSEEGNDLPNRESSSTVILRRPEMNADGGLSLGPRVMERLMGACATVWKGYVNIPDVAKFFTTVQVVSGDSQNLCRDLPESVDIVGRIVPETAWDYISKMKKCGTKEILVIRLTAASDEEKIPYIALFKYLNIKNRIGVVGNVSKMIKDFYIMPLSSNKPVPQVLLPLDGPGFEEFRPHLLLGILVRTRRKRPPSELSYTAKIPRYLPPNHAPLEERSYTPPLRSYTPPLPATGFHTQTMSYPPAPVLTPMVNNMDNNYTH